jgi:membrane dipeptidase
VSVVGPEHVGLGLDYVFDTEELDSYLDSLSETFPLRGGYAAFGPMRFVSPLQLRELTASLLDLGYAERDVRAILGENFHRVASRVWR